MPTRLLIGIAVVSIACAGCNKDSSVEPPKKTPDRSVKEDSVSPVTPSKPAAVPAAGSTATTGMASVEKDALAAAKAAARSALSAALAGYQESNYSPGKWKTLTGFKSAGDTAIDDACDLAAVTLAQNTATTGMAGIEKNSLVARKAAAQGSLTMALSTYQDSNYSPANWTTLTGFKTAGDAAVEAATNLAEVATALGTATKGMAGVEKDALAAAKTAAKTALAAALETYPEGNTSPANWKILTGFKTAGDAAIDASTDLAGVASAQRIATIGMAGVEKDALNAAKAEARRAVSKALASCKSSNYTPGNWATLIGFKTTADAAIDAATDLAGVNVAQNDVILRMGVVEKDALNSTKVTAKGALATALSGYIQSNYSPANWTRLTGFKTDADAAITAATDLMGIISAQSVATAGMADVEKDALNAAKAKAKRDLAAALSVCAESNYSPASWTRLTGFKTAGDAAIDAATDPAGVTTPFNTATNGIATVEKDALAAAKLAAKGVLATAFSGYIESNYSPANWAKLTGFKTAAEAAIDAATGLDGVTSALNAGLGRSR